MLFSGYALMGCYRSVTDYRNTYEGSQLNTPLPFNIRLQYIYAVTITVLELIIIVYLLKKVINLSPGEEKNIRIVLIILVPELYALFSIFGNPDSSSVMKFSDNVSVSEKDITVQLKPQNVEPIESNFSVPPSSFELLSRHNIIS